MKKYRLFYETFLGEFKSKEEAFNWADRNMYQEDEDRQLRIREVEEDDELF